MVNRRLRNAWGRAESFSLHAARTLCDHDLMRTRGHGPMLLVGSLVLGLLAGCGDDGGASTNDVGSVEIDGVETPLFENEDGEISVVDAANAPLCADVYADGQPMSEILEFEDFDADRPIAEAPLCMDDEGDAVLVASAIWDCDGRDIQVNDYGWGFDDGSGTWTAQDIRGCFDVESNG